MLPSPPPSPSSIPDPVAGGPVVRAQALPQVPQLNDTAVAADSLRQSLDRIGEGVTATGRLIMAGEWGLVLERALEAATGLVVGFVPSLISAVFVGIVFYILYRVLIRVAGGVLGRARAVDPGLEHLTIRTLRVVAWGFIAVLVLSQLGINVSALVAGLGIVGLAVGFAAKDSLENFIGGVTILLDRPFRVGDWITVEEHHGRVESITLRSTRIRTLNNQTVVFPSLQMVTKAVVNHTTGDPLRVDVPFGIAYKEDIDRTRQVVMDLVDPEDRRFARDGAHRMVVVGLGSSSVDLELHLFVDDPGYAVPLRFEYTEKIRKALARADIEIPFPHLQLFIDEARAFRDTPVRVVREGA